VTYFTDKRLEGADRITVGTSDITMRTWKELVAAGDQGLTKDELVVLVGPHINHGYARRRYLTHRKAKARSRYLANGSARYPAPSWETTELEPALAFVVTKTLSNMRRDRSAILGDDGRYRAGRKPRYQEHRERTLDMTGDRTRLHFNGNEAIRILQPALERHRTSSRAQLSNKEWIALERLVDLYMQAMELGFQGVD
jgi:hypothetical protein